MRKKQLIIAISIFFMLIASLLPGSAVAARFAGNDGDSDFAERLGDKLVRFHVVANSNSIEDQSIKLKIRDMVLSEIGGRLEKLETRAAALEYLKNHLSEIESIANRLLSDAGFPYLSRAYVDKFNFPVKSYGETTLPEGSYTALKIVLGNGNGKNWWCVMFPPLCFIDITRGLASEESNKQLSRVLNKDEISKISAERNGAVMKQTRTSMPIKQIVGKALTNDSSIAKGSQNKTKQKGFEIKFKSLELVEKLFK